MSFTHSCAHAHLIPIFPGSQRYPGSSIVPNKSSSMQGGSLSSRISWHSLGEAGNGSVCGCSAKLWVQSPTLGAASPFSVSFFREGEEQSVEHLGGFQLIYPLSVCLGRTLDLRGRWPGEGKVCVTCGWPGLHSAQGI